MAIGWLELSPRGIFFLNVVIDVERGKKKADGVLKDPFVEDAPYKQGGDCADSEKKLFIRRGVSRAHTHTKRKNVFSMLCWGLQSL